MIVVLHMILFRKISNIVKIHQVYCEVSGRVYIHESKRCGMSKNPVYFGSQQCSAVYETGAKRGQKCNSRAYYRDRGSYVCGIHSGNSRVKLKKDPNEQKNKEQELKKHELSVEAARLENEAAGRRGHMTCARMGMMSAAPRKEGYLNVFPNFKHQNRRDGFGCSALSPMSLGPVNHRQKELPPAKILENYHQFNKVLVSECENEIPSAQFRKLRLKGYKDSTPMRHKPVTATKRKWADDKAARAVLYSVHSDADGNERRYTWIQSRYFYCHFYQHLAQRTDQLRDLKQKRDAGTNLQITGYDGCDVDEPLVNMYKSTKRPFGHELVLYTMLTVDDPKDYPWNQYYEQHSDIYPSYLAPGYNREDQCQTEGPATVESDDEEAV